MIRNDFERFASLDRGISPMTLHRYGNVTSSYINPSIIEERKLNVASIRFSSRLRIWIRSSRFVTPRASTRKSQAEESDSNT
jgi:hypothetical protein